ncbi:2-dehydro-3-deoxygalactonokinase [Aminobacter sp. DSM 101952]|uniref:2-dehydro-3-deoxygalactonokinase n=1 Tax=Aminobacter sp. DSM 101952 TaxID=2735891 RepID=UPI0009E9E836|nr:2-dehydro-3-deoxygalactonokinase [Aminobacter sp. DSM 101952]
MSISQDTSIASTAAQGDAFCVAVDWGTSSFRAWLLARDGKVLAESRGPEGMTHCVTSGFEPVLRAHLVKLAAPASLPILICGMAGARQGWVEAPYVDAPTRLTDFATRAVRVPNGFADIRILPGIAQRDPLAPEVMRGEETQLLGLGAGVARQLVCMPGTHSKWVVLEDGWLRRFATLMTGELFGLLSKHSTLAFAIEADVKFGTDAPAFLNALDKGAADPCLALSRLFGVRAAQLLGFETRSDGAAHLSGLLIGAEVLAARQNFPDHADVTLVASGSVAELYRAALQRVGLNVKHVDADHAVRQGLYLAAHSLWA